ncbi:MAG: hypothetical protein LBT45_00635 [Rickettsiales bacterium]|jgi:hypothetical protein|nr:hypothetical protein [Rickettsiales bacterium]
MKKFPLLASCLLLLSSCGFSPMYSDNAALQKELADIYIAPIAGTNGIGLRNRLILAWNTANETAAKYHLSVKLNEPETIYKGLQRSGDATWEEVRIRAAWELKSGGKTIAKSSETASESYTFVSDLVSANASKISAIDNAIQEIGNQIELKVNAKLKRGDAR